MLLFLLSATAGCICVMLGKILLKMTATEILLDRVFSLYISNSFLFIQSTLESCSFSCVLLNPLIAVHSHKSFLFYLKSFSLEFIRFKDSVCP